MSELVDLSQSEITHNNPDGKKINSVAIVGYANETLCFLKGSKADEIWTMNHHLYLDEKKTPENRDLPRVDRLFELHRPEWFTRKEVPDAIKYREWLGKEHPFPIYMLEKMPEFPSAILFPRQELKHDLFKHLWRGAENEVEYYTSSICLMIGFAIHLGVKRIEFYGVEMASDTEYADQKPAAEFIMGMAMGRGIDIYVHPKCALLKAAVYGYEGVPHVVRARLDYLKIHYQNLEKKATKREINDAKNYREGKEKNPWIAMKSEAVMMMHRGVLTAIDTLFLEHDEYVSAQFLEEKINSYTYQRGYFQAETNMVRAKFETRKADNNLTEAQQLWDTYREKRATMFALDGAIQFFRKLREECRLQKPTHELTLNIVED